MTKLKLVPKIAGQFDTFDDWVSSAPHRIGERYCPADTTGGVIRAICVDAKGRRCQVGGDFQRARKERAFPVVYFWEFGAPPKSKFKKWEKTGLLTWTRERDGESYDYIAQLGTVSFRITRSTDAGFGISIFDTSTNKYLTERGGINWCQTRTRCQALAEKIAKKLEK